MLSHFLRASYGSLSFWAAGAFGTGISPTVTIPNGIKANDLLVLCVSSGGDTTTPSGWTLVGASGSGAARIATFYKVASGSETNFTLGNAQNRTQCVCLAYRPSNGAVTYGANTSNTGTTGTASTTVQNIAKVPALIISHFIATPNTTNIGTVSGTTSRALGTADGTLTNIRVVDETQYKTGNSTSRTASIPANTWIAHSFYFYVK